MRFFYPQPEGCFDNIPVLSGNRKCKKAKNAHQKTGGFSKKKQTKLPYKTGHNSGLFFYDLT